MKIGIDISQMLYEGTGVSSYTKNLTLNLLENHKDDKYILFAGVLRKFPTLLSYRKEKPWKSAKWKVWPFPPKIASFIFNTMDHSIDPYLGKVDVFHTSDWTEPKTRVPTVTTIHDLVFKKYPETMDKTIIKTQKKRLQRVKDQSAHIIVDSDSTKKDLIDLYHIDESRITTIHLAASPIFKPKKKKDTKPYLEKLSIQDPYILTVGTKEPRKNLQKTIEAFKSFKQKQDTDHKLVLAGNVGWGEQVSTADPDIIELGYVEEEVLPALYSAADVFVYPSLYEGFGLPVLEAMSCGAPVVTSDRSSLKEIAGEAAILVDPEKTKDIRDAMKKAITRKSVYEEKSLKQAKKFSWENTAQKTHNIYQKVYEANK